jgi:hypothetical protein
MAVIAKVSMSLSLSLSLSLTHTQSLRHAGRFVGIRGGMYFHTQGSCHRWDALGEGCVLLSHTWVPSTLSSGYMSSLKGGLGRTT